VTDDTLLPQQILEEMYFALQAEEVAAFCKMHTGPALARLSELAQTAADPKLRSEAAALLAKCRRGYARMAGTSVGGAPSNQATSRPELAGRTR
jgi:hypothetical protein